MFDSCGNILYLTRIGRLSRKKNNYLNRNCKYICFVYGYGDTVVFYPADSKKAMDNMRETFKKEKALLALKEKVKQ